MTSDLILHSPMLAAVLAVVIFLAAIIQVTLGMGFGMMAAPLAALIDPSLVPAPVMIAGMVTACWTAWRERRDIIWREVNYGFIGRFVGIFVAILVLSSLIGNKSFLLVFGALTGLAVILSASGWRMRFNMPNLIAMSLLSGFMGTITSVGAPPLAVLYAGQPPQTSRATLSAFFAFGALVSLAAQFGTGLAGKAELIHGAMMLAPMLAGIAVAARIKSQFDRRYRLALLVVAGMASVMLILRGLS
ncbi:MAG: sulfite exporter TauE/SafE family protein [Salaquimonas sp.]|nr:sulfite exporter TauE/SafE family protein [Salaquimonas sp.]